MTGVTGSLRGLLQDAAQANPQQRGADPQHIADPYVSEGRPPVIGQQELDGFVSKRRKSGVSAEEADGEQQPPARVNSQPAAASGQKQPQHKAAADVDQQRAVRKA